MEKQHYSSSDLKHAIACMPKLSQKLIGISKPYEKLLCAIITLDPNTSGRFPTDKKLMKDLGIKQYYYRKWLDQIYTDLIEMLKDEENPKLEVAKLEHHISWYRGDRDFLFVTTLPETPRIGSSFEVDFFRPISGHYHYYVESVSYELLDGKMIVHFKLRIEFFSNYIKFKEEQEEYEAQEMGFRYYLEWIKKKHGV